MTEAAITGIHHVKFPVSDLAASRDADLARQLAADIAEEAARLDRTIGGFLASARAAKAGA